MERAIVVGGGLGGLSAAIHLRLAGVPVTLLEANPRVGGRASRLRLDGYTFDTGPSLLNYPWVFEELFAAAGRRLDERLELLAIDPSVSFLWPDGARFTLSSDFARLSAECEALEPGSRAGLAAFLADAAAKYRIAFDKLVTRNVDGVGDWLSVLTWGEARRVTVWRSLWAELGRFFPGRRVREALGSYAMYLGGSPFDLPGFFTILPYGELAHGLWLPAGGVYALVEAIEGLARDLGVEVRCGARVEEIRVRGGRVGGVRLAGGALEEAPAVVSNVDVPTTDRELLAADAAPRRRRRAGRTRMTPGVLTFYWGVPGGFEGLPHHSIFLPVDYRGAFADLARGRIPEDLPFYVSVASRSDPSLAPEGADGVFVLVPMPLVSQLGARGREETVAAVRARVLARLAHHGWPLDPSAFAVAEAWTPADWEHRFGLFDGSAFGAAHRLSQIGPFRAANRNREVAGLYYAGAGTVPGTGMPMVTLSGRLAAERVVDG